MSNTLFPFELPLMQSFQHFELQSVSLMKSMSNHLNGFPRSSFWMCYKDWKVFDKPVASTFLSSSISLSNLCFWCSSQATKTFWDILLGLNSRSSAWVIRKCSHCFSNVRTHMNLSYFQIAILFQFKPVLQQWGPQQAQYHWDY